MKKEDFKIGEKINYMTVIELPIKEDGKWKCKMLCDCGKEVIKNISSLPRIKSCGCFNRSSASARCTNINKKYSDKITKHPLYNTYKSIKNRCYSKNYTGYLGGSIIIEDCWDNYEKFYNWAIDKWFDKSCLRRKNESLNFGPDNCYFDTKSSIIKENTDIEKSKETSIKRYGVSSYTKTDEYKERVKATNLSKYGVEYVLQSKDVKEKIKKTVLKKYGVEFLHQNSDIRNKYKKTCFEKFGCDTPLLNKDIKNKCISTCIEKYGTPYYTKTYGKEQRSLQNYIESITNKKFCTDRKVLNGKEIDIYNEEMKIGFEYCGLMWHFENDERDKNYHFNKFKKCNDDGIRLITIFSDEWLYRSEQVKGFISATLGIFEQRIYARKCEISEISSKDAMDFIEKYHIQGKGRVPIISYGLKYNGELIGAITLNKHHRNNKELVLDRLIFKSGVQIIGGANKLFSACIKYAKTNNYPSIISWSDNRWSIGNVYKKLNFEKDSELSPDYSYTNIKESKKKRTSKQSCTKKKIGCPKDKTEKEFMDKLGYKRVWDCGKIRWKFNVK